jgi:hypothetical protein
MILVFDSSVLNPFARVGRLADLQRPIALVDDLVRVGGARLPCDGAGFEAWAVKPGLLL